MKNLSALLSISIFAISVAADDMQAEQPLLAVDRVATQAFNQATFDEAWIPFEKGVHATAQMSRWQKVLSIRTPLQQIDRLREVLKHIRPEDRTLAQQALISKIGNRESELSQTISAAIENILTKNSSVFLRSLLFTSLATIVSNAIAFTECYPDDLFLCGLGVLTPSLYGILVNEGDYAFQRHRAADTLTAILNLVRSNETEAATQNNRIIEAFNFFRYKPRSLWQTFISHPICSDVFEIDRDDFEPFAPERLDV